MRRGATQLLEQGHEFIHLCEGYGQLGMTDESEWVKAGHRDAE